MNTQTQSTNRTILIAAGLVAVSAVVAAVTAVVLPDYLEAREQANTPLCIGNLNWQQAEKYGCRLR
jgi:hypothetical protein